MERRRVVITGIGAITPIGLTADGLWDGLRAQRSKVREISRFDPSLFRSRLAAQVDDFDPADRDNMFEEAARVIVTHQQGSTSLLQRRPKLGYNRAGRLLDQLGKSGIVGPFEGSMAREVLIPDEYRLEQ